MKSKALKKAGFISLILLGAMLLVVIAYLLYVIISYHRIPDNQNLSVVECENEEKVKLDTEYTIVTQNLGFGAYVRDFTFFMDGGKESVARSPESVKECINKGVDTTLLYDPDFILFQEIDIRSTRSYKIDQLDIISERLSGYSNTHAINYDSAFLFWPLIKPHGKSYSCIATYSKYNISSAIRRSLPISESFSKFLDLDRCYSVSRTPTENGKELVIYNVHSSAYGGSDEIRTAQMTMLMNDMKSEYDKGNYVVCGGDFNHDFTGTSTKDLNGGSDVDFGWAQPFPDDLIPEGITKCVSYKDGKINPSCRNCDIPYEDGNFTIIVDGFFVSENIECVTVENIVTGFEYSDHNPVVMKFKLK